MPNRKGSNQGGNQRRDEDGQFASKDSSQSSRSGKNSRS